MNNEKELTFKKLFLPPTTKKIIAIITGTGFLVYFNILFNGFVWDDLTYIIGNKNLKPFNLFTLMSGNEFNSSGYYRPLPAIYFSILYNLFNNSAFFYHFIQLSLHVICAILLYLIFKKFFKPALALVLSLVFLVHPINVESVAYIGASQSELYFLFGGLAFYLCLKDILENKRIFLVHTLLLFALLTKEVSVLFFFVIYFYRLLYRKTISKLFLLSSFITVFIYSFIRFVGLGGTIIEKMHRIPISLLPLISRLAHIPIVFFYYLKTFFFPKLLVINQVWTINDMNLNSFYFPLAMDIFFFACIFGALYYLARKKDKNVKLFVFFLTWFLCGMAFLMQVFPLDMTVADRWFYLPLVGLLGMFAIILGHFWVYIKRHKNFCLTTVIVVLVLLSIRTVIRNNDWRTPISLYSKDIKVYENYDIENYLGAELVYANRYQEALPHFLKSVKLLPHDTNLYNVGSVYEHLNNPQKALLYYQKTLDAKHDSSGVEVRKLAYEGLGRMLLLTQSPTTIVPQIKQAVKEFPDDGALWAFLAINQYYTHQEKEALTSSEKAKTLLPNQYTNQLYDIILNKKELKLR